MNRIKNRLLQCSAFTYIVALMICIILGFAVGLIVLIAIEPSGAMEAMSNVIKNFMDYKLPELRLKYLGSTLVKTAPLMMCALSVVFAKKAGLFNIGVAGQYTFGSAMAIFSAVTLGLPWYLCIIIAMLSAALVGLLSAILKSYYNVSEIISGIMLNWIVLYLVNTILLLSKNPTSNYTNDIIAVNPSGLIPKCGLDKIFGNNEYVTIAIILAIICSVIVWIIIEKTILGFEIKASGFNPYASQYCGIKSRKIVLLTLAISAAIAGLGGALYYLTGYENWSVTSADVPQMGFDGISAAFLGCLNPIGVIASSLFIRHIMEGGAHMDIMTYGSHIANLISSVIIYLCAFTSNIENVVKKILGQGVKK